MLHPKKTPTWLKTCVDLNHNVQLSIFSFHEAVQQVSKFFGIDSFDSIHIWQIFKKRYDVI
jgi:hypothetical protein